jgi:hypothetical protein
MLNQGLGEASDELIACVLIVLYFTVSSTRTRHPNHPKLRHQIDGGDFTECEAHLRGIHQMIKVRGRIQNLGIRGQLRRWLGIYCHGPWPEGWEEGHFRYLCEH